MKKSTREFFLEGRKVPSYSLFDFIHGYVYARLPYLYIGIGTGEHPVAKAIRPVLVLWRRLFPSRRSQKSSDHKPGVTFADTYHGKVVPLGAARQLVEIKRDLRLENLEPMIPYTKARDLILQHPDHIAVLDCPCRVARKNPCLPLDVCLIVGEPFVHFIEEHHTKRSRRISSEEAVAILQAEDKRGHVHHAFFKDAMLGRFYAICNCCDCCCGAMQAHRHGTPMLTSSGYLASIDADQCTNCGTCREYCQFHALSELEGVSVVSESACMGCGVCTSKCPEGAISLVLAPQKGTPLELFELMQIS